MPLEAIVKKAQKLMRSRRIERIGDGVYNVIGDHGTYTVVERMDGSVLCNCPGFARNRICSHSLAVMLLRGKARRV